MGRPGPETRLIAKMRKAAKDYYGDRLVIIKYHGNEFAQGGVSDLLCCLDGVFIAAEVKAPESYGGSVERALAEGPSVRQAAFIKKVREAGGMAAVVASVDQFMYLLLEAAKRERF